jgi:Tfp pilus assembly protein PilP
MTAPFLAGFLLFGASAQNYDSQGKRDPFMGPREAAPPPNLAPPAPDKRPPGLTGLLISEVTVAGTAASLQERVVILKGVDKVTYLARKGDRLFDGFVADITPDEVIFNREIVDPNGGKRSVRIVKRLYTEDK